MPTTVLTYEAVQEFAAKHEGFTLHTLRDFCPFDLILSEEKGAIRFIRPNGGYETANKTDIEHCVAAFNRFSPEERQHPTRYTDGHFFTSSSYVASLLQAVFNGAIPSAVSKLKPNSKARIIDLLSVLGFDVRDWKNYRGSNPATNPRYCYNWTFSDKSQVAFCVWFHQIREFKGSTFQLINYRNVATRVTGPAKHRAREMDKALRKAAKDQISTRVIILDGDRDPQTGSRPVTFRALDSVAWTVTSYDEFTGQCRLDRGKAPFKFADQFTDDQSGDPKRRKGETNAFVRSRIIALRVLAVANGICESCGERGFSTADGRIYLETHHILSLAEGGRDNTLNVIALCPNEHREAHSGARKEDLRKRFYEAVAARKTKA